MVLLNKGNAGNTENLSAQKSFLKNQDYYLTLYMLFMLLKSYSGCDRQEACRFPSLAQNVMVEMMVPL